MVMSSVIKFHFVPLAKPEADCSVGFLVIFCTLRAVLKFSVGTECGCHKICVEVLHHIGEVLVNFCFIFISLQSKFSLEPNFSLDL